MTATVKDVTDEIAALKNTIATEKSQVAANLQSLHDQVATLQTQLGAGTVVSSSDLDNILASLKSAQTDVENITEPGAAPATDPNAPPPAVDVVNTI